MEFSKTSSENLPGTVDLRHSIGFELLARVFSVYFIVTLTVTGGHILLTYLDAQDKITEAFVDLKSVFGPGIAQSLWNEDDDQVRSILKGMMNVPVIKGVKIEDPDGNVMGAGGRILTDESSPVTIDLESGESVADAQSFLQDIIFQRFQLVYVEDEEKYDAGFITLYSDNNYAFEQVRYDFLIIIVNSIIKTTALWYIFLWFAKRRLSRPLALLTAATEQLHLDALENMSVDTKVRKRNEIKILEGGFNEMVQKLIQARESLKELNRNLEKLVEQRTEELEEALQALNEQYHQLQQTQTQLVQSEKMAGLGTLVAGVAHEINNPTNFVHMSSHTLDQDLEEFQSEFFEMLSEESDPEILQHFQARFDRFSGSLSSINEGSDRIKTIVQDLRTFSRLDEAEQKIVAIVENLETTLRLLQTQYKDQVKFVCDFQVNPEIECFPAELNQVFMNLMVNACQAIAKKRRDTQDETLGGLTIRTFIQKNELGIAFEDTGCGMSEEVKQKMFEPFFTTKEVGEGTGMGMSISFGIIEKHQGRIEVESILGEGTNITVLLPLMESKGP